MDKKSITDVYNGIDYDNRNYHFEGEFEFWIQEAKKCGNTILELCCGTGRILLPLAEKGFDVTGIDITESMFEAGMKKVFKNNLM
jgi:ubiquinone/menaquinone biosynthesis C-methylase UbiE